MLLAEVDMSRLEQPERDQLVKELRCAGWRMETLRGDTVVYRITMDNEDALLGEFAEVSNDILEEPAAAGVIVRGQYSRSDYWDGN